MTPELWQRLKPLYSAALDLPRAGRSGYVEQMCARDPELARELMALLAVDSNVGNTLDPHMEDISYFPNGRSAVLPHGTVLAGRFRIVRHLGSGGMGDVYEALDLQMEQGRIALKTIRPAIADDPAALARFKDEVRLARQLTGPNICRIHELYLTGPHEHAHCAAFLTMELLEGVTLHDRIQQASPLPVAQIRVIAEQLCAALGCIHEAGIIHRDLKPRNVMLSPHHGGERVVVMDFGLARAAAGASDPFGASLGRAGLIVGTPSYMAPEQFEGGEVSPATDVYALGLILYELATGVQPFAAHSPLAAAVRRAKRPETASTVRNDLPPAWDEVITRCLQYDPAHRFQSAADVLQALQHPQRFVMRLGSTHHLAVSRRKLLGAVLAAIVLLAVGAFVLIRNAGQRQLSPEVAHWNTLGMTALREGSYLKATGLLSMVTQRDPKYPVAHAALADAWTELDFTDNAQREMLLASAPTEQRGLSDAERHYIDAVRSTMLGDYTGAAGHYQSILTDLHGSDQAQGYVDLGRTYERGGKLAQSMESYEKAAQLNPDDPAAFVHLGILKSRLRDTAGALAAFNRAEALYRTESDMEGRGEVAYQRGYAANERGAYRDATEYLTQALQIARQISSVQMEVRSLSQLSTVNYRQGKDEAAATLARDVINKAQESGLEYWAIDGLVRLGNASMDKEDFGAAEPVLLQALHEAQTHGHLRLKAAADLSLASMRNQQKRLDEQISFAQTALEYYRTHGFLDAADNAEVLVLRGYRDKEDYAQALRAGQQLLTLADQTNSTLSVIMAEELVGGVLLRMERYPEALALYERALKADASMGHSSAYLHVHRANALWRMGRYDEAEAELAGISPDALQRKDVSASVLWVRAQMEESKGHLPDAATAARAAWTRDPNFRMETADLDRTVTLAEAQTGSIEQARSTAAHLVAQWQQTAKATELAKALLTQATISLRADDAAAAETQALQAERLFAAKGLRESDALSLIIAAEAARQIGKPEDCTLFSTKSVDIFKQLAQSWGTPAFQTYLTRPDRRQALHTLTQLRRADGDVSDAIFATV